MHGISSDQRVIAFDVRSQRVGYVVFEGARVLLDWGVKGFRGGVNTVHVPFDIKIARLLSEWQPHTVVLKEPIGSHNVQRVKAIQAQAESCGIKVHFIDLNAVTNAFPPVTNKYERARLISASFPELAAHLRPKRKAWQPEHYQMSIFDAATLGAAHFWRANKNPNGASLSN